MAPHLRVALDHVDDPRAGGVGRSFLSKVTGDQGPFPDGAPYGGLLHADPGFEQCASTGDDRGNPRRLELAGATGPLWWLGPCGPVPLALPGQIAGSCPELLSTA